jgi:lantibiotic modifying enzyme
MKSTIALLSLLGVALLQGEVRPNRDAAIQAARWIEASSIRLPTGTVWPADPRDPKSVQTNLYSGTPGVVLFFLELYRSTGERPYLASARSGADHLASVLPDEKGAGLYEGLAGLGFTLTETFKITRDGKYRQAALRAVQIIGERARKRGQGVEWSDTTDIISGSAGTGLFLLYAAKELNNPAARELAVLAGHRLIELGRPENDGLKWAMDPEFPRLMPNFAHGTAGVAYFLATLYRETKDPVFLKAASSGARYLQAIAETSGDTCLIFHDEPDNKSLYYLGWCHGPTGTARLFYRLFQATGDKNWLEWTRKSARGLLQSGIPEKETPGFWNNAGQCCGSAGVAEFFLDLYRATHEEPYLAFARRVNADLLARATRDAQGMRWIQAEHRARPELLVSQTGLMQGAAGIGLWLLHLDGLEHGGRERIILPDSPF